MRWLLAIPVLVVVAIVGVLFIALAPKSHAENTRRAFLMEMDHSRYMTIPSSGTVTGFSCVETAIGSTRCYALIVETVTQ